MPVEFINKTEEWAQELASRGLAIFPLRPQSKKPYGGEKWGEIMTTEAEKIHGWFEHRPNMNYGVCGRKDHVVIDLDVKTANGVQALTELHAELEDMDDYILGDTFTVSTPSGGQHLYLKTDKTAGNTHRFPKGIDVRGHMGYVVGPGCYVKDDKVDGPYEVTADTQLKDAPTWVKDLLKEGREKVRVYKEPAFDLDSPESIQRGIEMLKHRDPAIEGMGGDIHTYHTALQLIDLGLSQEVCIEVMNQPYMKAGDETPGFVGCGRHSGREGQQRLEVPRAAGWVQRWWICRGCVRWSRGGCARLWRIHWGEPVQEIGRPFLGCG
jgi:hypothetical protein